VNDNTKPIEYFKTSPEIIRLAMMYYIRYSLSFCQVEDILHEIGVAGKQLCDGRINNSCENSDLPFRRQERAMLSFKTVQTLQTFVSSHNQVYYRFNHQRHLESKKSCKQKRPLLSRSG